MREGWQAGGEGNRRNIGVCLWSHEWATELHVLWERVLLCLLAFSEDCGSEYHLPPLPQVLHDACIQAASCMPEKKHLLAGETREEASLITKNL